MLPLVAQAALHHLCYMCGKAHSVWYKMVMLCVTSATNA